MISPTAISTYLYCPRKLFLEKVLKITKFPKDSMVKGTVKHEIYEHINNKEKDIVLSISNSNKEKIFNIYKKEYSTIARKAILKHLKKLKELNVDELKLFNNFWPTLSQEAEDRATNLHNFIKENNLFGEQLWQILTPKITCEKWITDNDLQLRGIIDELRVYDDLTIPVELKSGSAPKTGCWPGHKAQIAAYMVMLKNQGKTIKEGIVKYIDEKKEVKILMNSFLEDELLKQIGLVNEIINSQEIPKHLDNFNKCSACQLNEDCYNKKIIEKKVKEKIIFS